MQVLVAESGCVGFDWVAAGVGSFRHGGSQLFHARRSVAPRELGASITVDLLAPAM
jgi:hypothetical protein